MNEQTLRAAVQSNPNDHVSWHALGLHAFNQGNLPLAVQCIEAAIALGKKIGLYQRNLGEMYRRMGQTKKAVSAGHKAVKLMPGDVDALYNLGLALTDSGQFDEAIRAYRQVLKIDERHNLAWNNLGSALEQQGNKAAALTAYEKAIAIEARHAEAQNNAGAIYSEQGRLDDARKSFRYAIEARHDFVEAHYNLSSLKKYTPDDPHLAMLEHVFAQRQQLSNHARIRYAFALGKALDDIGEFERAFAAYDEGNRLQHLALPMDEVRADTLVQQIIATFDEKFFKERRTWSGTADPARVPVFIVGMPRSGTTLLEQILCSHASVHGAGELVNLNEAVTKATGSTADRPFTSGVSTLTEADLKKLGDAYLRSVWKLSPGSSYITDKMPANFFYLGLIHLALPHAKIIHAMRDPMDSCFSCFSRLFNDTMEFAYDQDTLGHYYRRYIMLMRHWHKVLPAGSILDLPYEDMVADTEGQARRVLEFVGLPWDENCLKFHENKRLVKTASVAQVRQPIYKSSVARWKHFARHLRPLFDLVKEFRPEDDAAQLVYQAAPESPEQLHTQGIAHYRKNRFEEALDQYNQAIALKPDFPAALNSRGFVLQDMDRMDEALCDFSRAVELAPEMAMARLNLGMAQLKLGDWANGWANYEARWTGSAEAGAGNFLRPATPLPLWQGDEETRGKRLLVFTEQGFGDTFQMARFLPALKQRFAKIGFACSPPTQRLMEWSFGDQLLTLTRLPTSDDAWADWDCQCALMSLPGILQIRPDSIPSAIPYLKVPESPLRHWHDRLERSAPGRIRIGIAWAGRKEHQNDKRRSLTFDHLTSLLGDERVTWVSLQKWAPQDVRPTIPEGVDWLDWTDELSDFADTAALVSQLDLVISIDSAMVHLAGALGRPVWMMDRFDNEWRWLRHREDSPWYPTLRIFRQLAFGEWEPVLKALVAALSALEPTRPLQAAPKRLAPAAKIPPVGMPLQQPAPSLLPEQAMQLAAQLQTAGRLAEAESLLQKILQAQPSNAHALHLLGVIAYQAGNPQQGIELILQAVQGVPDSALFHSNLAEICRQQGLVDQAIHHGEYAVKLDPSMASAWSNLGIACYDAKLYDRSEQCHARALAISPHLVQSLNNMGSLMRARKNKAEAAAWYRKTLAIAPEYLEALSNLGAVLVENEQHDAAVAPLEQALSINPTYPEALCNLGLARFKQDQVEIAIGLLQRSLQLRPDYPEALVGLATALHEQGDLKSTKALLHRALHISPGNTSALVLQGTTFVESDQSEEAEAAYCKALNLDSECVDALTGLGNLRVEQGKIDAAEALLNQALSIDADNLGARFHLIQARKVGPNSEHVAFLAAKLKSESTPDKLITLHYALGKAYDDQKNWDAAFPHFLEGARLKRSKLDYDPDQEQQRVEQIVQTIDGDFIRRHQGAGNPSSAPIFVLGMPRSGTTLTEQILASHPDVFGAGELRDLMDICQQQDKNNAFLPYPANLTELNKQTLTQWGEDYIAALRQRAPNVRHITDKMPANYLALGLIPLMLPNARIIHVRRNPIDTCVSCFTRLFNRHQDATYDLAELGRHYVNYARLMDHWRTVLPTGTFLEVAYEDMVADMPEQARRLIGFVGLPWNSACLDFHKTERNVRTASVTQVRQPIYNSSVARWKHYEKYLGPLLDALGEYAKP